MKKGAFSFYWCFMGIFLLLSLFFSPSNASGNTVMRQELAKIWQDAQFKLGPLRIKTVLFFNNAGYDSNVYRTRAEPIRDFTFSTGPAVTVYLPFKKRFVFSIHESPRYVYFKETKRERSWNQYFSAGVHFFINRFLFSLHQGYSNFRERWNTEIDIRPRSKVDVLSTSVLWKTSKRVSFSLGYTKRKLNYEMIAIENFNLGHRLNRTENYLSLTNYYQIASKTRTFLSFEYGSYGFEQHQGVMDSNSYRVSGGFDFSPISRIRGQINLGYKVVDILNTGGKDFSGLVGDTRIDVRFLKRFRARVSYQKDLHFSAWYDNAYFLQKIYGAGLSLYLILKIRLDYDFRTGRNIYSTATPLAQSQDSSESFRNDTYQIHTIGLYFRIKNNVGIGLTFNSWNRDSNLIWENDRRNFFGLNLTYDF